MDNNDLQNMYVAFMQQYDKDHANCPKCGSGDCMTTLVGYVLNLDRPQDYKDLNSCTCMKCGDRHTRHDRIGITKNYGHE